jgi:hypothetical protein
LKLEDDLATVAFACGKAIDELGRFASGSVPCVTDVRRSDAYEAR